MSHVAFLHHRTNDAASGLSGEALQALKRCKRMVIVSLSGYMLASTPARLVSLQSSLINVTLTEVYPPMLDIHSRHLSN